MCTESRNCKAYLAMMALISWGLANSRRLVPGALDCDALMQYRDSRHCQRFAISPKFAQRLGLQVVVIPFVPASNLFFKAAQLAMLRSFRCYKDSQTPKAMPADMLHTPGKKLLLDFSEKLCWWPLMALVSLHRCWLCLWASLSSAI